MNKENFKVTRYYISESGQYLLLVSVCYVEHWQTVFGNQMGFVISYFHISPYDFIINRASSCCSKLPDLTKYFEIDAKIAEECLHQLNNFYDLLGHKIGKVKEVAEETGYYINQLPQRGVIRNSNPIFYKSYIKCGGSPVISNYAVNGQFESIDLGSITSRISIFETNKLPQFASNISEDDFLDVRNACNSFMFKIYAKLALIYVDKLTIRPITI